MAQMPNLQRFFPLKKPGGQESISFSPDPDISSCVFNPKGEKERERNTLLDYETSFFLWSGRPRLCPKPRFFHPGSVSFLGLKNAPLSSSESVFYPSRAGPRGGGNGQKCCQVV